ncbi:MAG: winged helix-turn-helix transcriptional regulator [Clostridia bacterium]|nr:winged helix-turn-helix transcriptional regulator [Clostridia bacterium]
MNKKQTETLNDFFLHSALYLLTLEEQCLRKCCASDLSIRELHVLEAVSEQTKTGKNTMAEIAKYLKLSPASLTTAVNVLVKKGYIVRDYSPLDRRVIFVRLTEKGSEANSRYLDFVRDMIGSACENLDEAGAEKTIEVMTKLREYLEEGAKN